MRQCQSNLGPILGINTGKWLTYQVHSELAQTNRKILIESWNMAKSDKTGNKKSTKTKLFNV